MKKFQIDHIRDRLSGLKHQALAKLKEDCTTPGVSVSEEDIYNAIRDGKIKFRKVFLSQDMRKHTPWGHVERMYDIEPLLKKCRNPELDSAKYDMKAKEISVSFMTMYDELVLGDEKEALEKLKELEALYRK